jgi:hypothetical protein
VFFIDVDTQLKDEKVLRQMLDFFDLDHEPVLNMKLRRNRTPFIGPTRISPEDELEIQAVMQDLPDVYKTMLRGEPYSKCSEWEGFRLRYCG